VVVNAHLDTLDTLVELLEVLLLAQVLVMHKLLVEMQSELALEMLNQQVAQQQVLASVMLNLKVAAQLELVLVMQYQAMVDQQWALELEMLMLLVELQILLML